MKGRTNGRGMGHEGGRIVPLAGWFVVVWTLFGLMGCSEPPEWFLGEYTLDKEKTLEGVMQDPKASVPGSDRTRLEDLLQRITADIFTPGERLRISEEEILWQQNNSRATTPYQIYKTDGADLVIIQMAGGKLQTWKRTPDGLCRPASRELPLELYYKKVGKIPD